MIHFGYILDQRVETSCTDEFITEHYFAHIKGYNGFFIARYADFFNIELHDTENACFLVLSPETETLKKNASFGQ